MSGQRLLPSRHVVPVLVMLLAGCLMVATGALAQSLTAQQQRGRQIYFTGTSPAGRPMVAYFGEDLLEVPGEAATCTSCHGYDGLGRAESGVIPSNISWQHLMKSYGHLHADGLQHAPFTRDSLKSYMRDGIYPGGRKGDPSMPVYDMAEADLDDLLAYLQGLGSYQDPGVSESAIKIGTLIPAAGPGAELGEVIAATITAYFNDINNRGGIYGRRLELIVEKAGAGQQLALPVRQLAGERVLALIAPYTPGKEQELSQLAEELQLPLIAPVDLSSMDSQSFLRYRFVLSGGLHEQTCALATAAVRKLPLHQPTVAIVYPQKSGDSAAEAAEAIYRSNGWQKISRYPYTSGAFDGRSTFSRLRQEQAAILLFLGGEIEAAALFAEIAAAAWAPTIFMPGTSIGKALSQVPGQLGDKLWLSFPSLPDDRKAWGMAEFVGMAQRQKLTVSHQTVQLAAYAGTKVFVEGLRRSGRDLSRERLVETLDRLFEYDTGLTPPISYGKNRRTGSRGAHVVTVDPLQAGKKEFITPRGWINLD